MSGRPPSAARVVGALVDSTMDAIIALDRDGRVLRWSWGATNLYGHEAKDAVGRPVAELIVPPPLAPDWQAALAECVATGSAVRDGVRRRRDGVEVLTQSLLRWVPAADGEDGFVVLCDSDVSEPRRLEGELSDQVWRLEQVEQFLKGILDASADYSIVALDLERKVAAWNTGATYDFGYAPGEVQGRPFEPLVAGAAEADKRALDAAFEACRRDGHVEVELAMSRQDRREFPARLTLTVRKDPYGEAAGFVLIAKDLSDERRAEQERRLALERLLEIRRLAEVDKIKSAILNTTAHELATPLTPIRLQLHVLKSGLGESPSMRKAYDTVQRNFSRLTQVVQGMVEVVNLQGGLRLERRILDLAASMRGLVESNEGAAQAAGLRLRADALQPTPVHGDAVRLMQLGQHLLDNALRFTPSGGHVDVEVSQAGGQARLRVTDQGPGLTPAQIDRLFAPFSQVHDTTQHTRGGVGVGLYICKAIADAHGGRIWVESPGPGRGSSFVVDLPQQPEPVSG